MMMAMESVELSETSQQQLDNNDKVPVSLEHIQIETPEERLIYYSTLKVFILVP